MYQNACISFVNFVILILNNFKMYRTVCYPAKKDFFSLDFVFLTVHVINLQKNHPKSILIMIHVDEHVEKRLNVYLFIYLFIFDKIKNTRADMLICFKIIRWFCGELVDTWKMFQDTVNIFISILENRYYYWTENLIAISKISTFMPEKLIDKFAIINPGWSTT